VGSFGLAGKRNGVVSNRSEEQRAKSEEQGTKLIANCQLQRRVVSTAGIGSERRFDAAGADGAPANPRFKSAEEPDQNKDRREQA